jgi:methionyl-tRNA formyltransferase
MAATELLSSLALRTVYLGTSDYAAAVLRRLHNSAHRPTLVVSRPDSPQGRGRKLAPPPTVVVARELGLEVIQPERVNADDVRTRIDAQAPERLIVCAYGALIKDPLLSDRRILNVHPSLLPRWRGAAPIERAILAGDSETGVSIMVLTAGLDSGPVCLTQSVPIGPEEDYGELVARLEQIGGDLLVQALDQEAAGADPARCAEQDESAATYAEKLTAADRRLDPREPAVKLDLRVRALNPHVGAYLEIANAERLGVGRARPVAAVPSAAGPGTLLLDGARPVLVCGEGALELITVKPAGKRMMAAEDYVRGLRR